MIADASVGIYLAIWHKEHKADATRWMRNRATSRRWWPTEGQEFSIVADSRCFNTAYHCLRLLAGGISGMQGIRSNDTRNAHPRRCVTCNTDGIAFTWRTPSANQAGLAWCGTCAPSAVQHGNAWALLAGIPVSTSGRPTATIAEAGERNTHCQTADWVRGQANLGIAPSVGMGSSAVSTSLSGAQQSHWHGTPSLGTSHHYTGPILENPK